MKKFMLLASFSAFFILCGITPAYADPQWVRVQPISVAQSTTMGWVIGTSLDSSFTGDHVFVFPSSSTNPFLASALTAMSASKVLVIYVDSIASNPSNVGALTVE